MQDPEIDESAAPSTVTDVEQESSPAAPAEAPAQQAEQTEAPFHEHPRWKQVLEERDFLKQQLAAAINRPAAPVAAPQIQEDPYAGMTPEEKAFYAKVEEIAERKANKIVSEKETIVRKELDETRQMTAMIAYERFQAKHPDVTPGSQEEVAIANLYNRGYSLEDAYKVAMFDKIQQGKVTQAQVKKVQTIQQKLAANVETSGIPASSGMPPAKKMSIREFVEEQYRKGVV